jgi:hypothetical protein
MILKIPEITKEIETILNETPNLNWSIEADKIEGLSELTISYVTDPSNQLSTLADFQSITLFANKAGEWLLIRDDDELDTKNNVFLDLFDAVKAAVAVWPPKRVPVQDDHDDF